MIDECEFGCFCEEPGAVTTLLDDTVQPADFERVIQEKLARAERYRAVVARTVLPETD
jgi:hypothetical protein